LEQSLRDQEKLDEENSRLGGEDYAKHAWCLTLCDLNEEGEEAWKHEQWKMIVKIRKCLKEYNKALVLHDQVSALPEPKACNVESLRAYIKRLEYGHYLVSGPGAHAWGNLRDGERPKWKLGQHFTKLLRSITPALHRPPPDPAEATHDLVSPVARGDQDSLTHWILDEWIPFYDACKDKWKGRGRKKELPRVSSAQRTPDDFRKYPVFPIAAFTSVVATILASLLPIAAIALLTTVEGKAARLGLITAFTAIFTTGLLLCTNPGTPKVHIFTGSSAFLAVLVVFMQNF